MIITKCQTVSWLELIEELTGVRGKSYDLVLGNAYNLRMFDMIACHNSDNMAKKVYCSINYINHILICQNATKINKSRIDYLNNSNAGVLL